MAQLVIRNLPEQTKARLRRRAARHGHSMEAEARNILKAALAKAPAPENIAVLAQRLFGSEGGVDLEIPKGLPPREPPEFAE